MGRKTSLTTDGLCFAGKGAKQMFNRKPAPIDLEDLRADVRGLKKLAAITEADERDYRRETDMRIRELAAALRVKTTP